MSTPTRIDRWQTSYATIGARYRLAYLAQESYAISTGTVAEFKRVLDNRDGVTVEKVQLLGRVMSADVTVNRSASLLWLLGEYIVAGSPAITFKLIEVYALSPQSSLAQTVVGGTVQTGQTLFNAGKDVADAISNAFDKAIPNIGEQIGSGVGAAIKPLIFPLILLLIGMFLYNQALRGGR